MGSNFIDLWLNIAGVGGRVDFQNVIEDLMFMERALAMVIADDGLIGIFFTSLDL